ncbi:hypothetical protein D9M70_567100 [compost metagenome]
MPRHGQPPLPEGEGWGEGEMPITPAKRQGDAVLRALCMARWFSGGKKPMGFAPLYRILRGPAGRPGERNPVPRGNCVALGE